MSEAPGLPTVTLNPFLYSSEADISLRALPVQSPELRVVLNAGRYKIHTIYLVILHSQNRPVLESNCLSTVGLAVF